MTDPIEPPEPSDRTDAHGLAVVMVFALPGVL